MMDAKKVTHQEYKVFKHKNGKYALLNSLEQTPAQYVVGQRYKIGTGVAIVQTSPRQILKKMETSYKEFLSMLLKNYTPDQLIAFKWIPTKIMKAKKLSQQKCHPEECVNSCIQPGCFCINKICQ